MKYLVSIITIVSLSCGSSKPPALPDMGSLSESERCPAHQFVEEGKLSAAYYFCDRFYKRNGLGPNGEQLVYAVAEEESRSLSIGSRRAKTAAQSNLGEKVARLTNRVTEIVETVQNDSSEYQYSSIEFDVELSGVSEEVRKCTYNENMGNYNCYSVVSISKDRITSDIENKIRYQDASLYKDVVNSEEYIALISEFR